MGVSLIPDDSPAWPSALGRAAALGSEIDAVQRQIRQLTELLAELRRRQRAWETGGRGEQAVVRVLVGMDAAWHVLADRRWPGTRRANIDVLLVGPGGVFVIDVKTWRAEVRVERAGSGAARPTPPTMSASCWIRPARWRGSWPGWA